MPIPSGSRIDGYEVLGLLGAGGMGEVYRARDPFLKREVAIKVLPASVAQNADRLRRFEQEAQAAAALNDPNILVIYRFGSFEGAPYLVSELLEGETLRHRLEQGPVSVQKAIEIGVQIARGLAAAHDKGIVHRDLKPENLFITKDGRTKILDFGLAKLMPRPLTGNDATVTQGTDAGIVFGTVGYMSPEQVRGAVVDYHADIFSLGAILYEMLAGRRAFHRLTPAETMTAILNEEPQSISQIAPVTPPGLQRVVKRCLEKHPEQRFQSASDLAFALEALSDSRGAVMSPSAVSRQMPRDGARLALWIGGAAALVAIGYLVLNGRSRAPNLRVTEYSQLTHSGNAGQPVGTDGVTIYLSSGISLPTSRVAVTGGEIEPFTKLPTRSELQDLSPDGTTLLYLVYQTEVGATAPLYSLKVLGGSPHYLGTVNGAAWSPDGKSILYDADGDIFRMNVDGTNRHKLISAGGTIDSYSTSPDGKRIRYFKDRALWEATSSGADLHQLLREWYPGQPKCCGSWSPDGLTFAFSAYPNSQIWAVDERKTLFHKSTGEPIPLTSSPTRWGYLVFSKDGKRIFCTGSTRRGELIRFDQTSKHFQPFLGGISAHLLSFSQDGRTVAYSTYPDNILWKSGVDGTGRIQLVDVGWDTESVSASPDGSQVAFMARPPESKLYRAYVVSQEGMRLLLPKSSGPEAYPNWSPDGHRIAFGTSSFAFGTNSIEDKDPLSDIRTLDLDTKQVSTVPDSSGKFFPRWSPNGQFLLASSLDASNLYIFDFRTNQWTQIYKGISAFASWSHDSRFIYTFRYAGDPAILRVPVKGGVPELVADVKDIRFTSTLNLWFGLDPTDAPLLLRDESTSDVYSLSLQFR